VRSYNRVDDHRVAEPKSPTMSRTSASLILHTSYCPSRRLSEHIMPGSLLSRESVVVSLSDMTIHQKYWDISMRNTFARPWDLSLSPATVPECNLGCKDWVIEMRKGFALVE
jgi:hypothetical protein